MWLRYICGIYMLVAAQGVDIFIGLGLFIWSEQISFASSKLTYWCEPTNVARNYGCWNRREMEKDSNIKGTAIWMIFTPTLVAISRQFHRRIGLFGLVNS